MCHESLLLLFVLWSSHPLLQFAIKFAGGIGSFGNATHVFNRSCTGCGRSCITLKRVSYFSLQSLYQRMHGHRFVSNLHDTHQKTHYVLTHPIHPQPLLQLTDTPSLVSAKSCTPICAFAVPDVYPPALLLAHISSSASTSALVSNSVSIPSSLFG